ncbi:hypothetical protein P3W45_001693 [Vairimorpha bombi]|jgi:serine/threonine protein kinase
MFTHLQKVSIIAKGRYSEIYKYVNTVTTDLYVIKKHPKVVLGYKKECNVRELDVFKRIQPDTHPNIVKYYGYSEDEEDGYFLLEYINGYDLNRIINESKTNKIEKYISKESVLNYVEQLIEGLEYLHGKGIYHCDIKPENILVYKDRVKIVDFGSSIISSKQVINVKDEDFIGTPGHLPPEIADYTYRGDVDLEHVDVFGLGSVLFFCYTKFVPFIGKMSLDTSNNVKNMNVDLNLVKDEGVRNILKHIFTKTDRWTLSKVKEEIVKLIEKGNHIQ